MKFDKLDLELVSKDFIDDKGRKISAIKDISLKVQDKEFVVMVGPSGSGKTTLLKIVAGLSKPSSGAVSVNGDPMSGPKREVGLVFQQPTCFEWLTVIQNVEFGLKLQGAKDEKRKEIAQHFVDAVGLSGYEDAYIKTLSEGMKQRVALATVFANNPEVLLMDEPFSALDAQTRALMQELVLTLWEETKKTVLFVTHDIEEAIFLADTVYVMSAKPGEIKDVIRINLPRPRTPDMKLSEEFIILKKHISYIIRGEAIKAANVKLDILHPKAIKVGMNIWPGFGPLYVADEFGLYKKKNLTVELLNLEKDEDRIRALVNGEIDMLGGTIDTALLAKLEGAPVQMVMAINRSWGGDALIAKKGIKRMEDLRGKKIATEKRWLSHYFLLYLLDLYKISVSEVEIVYMKGSDIGAELITGAVDAAVLWEPWLSQARKLANAPVLVSSKDIPDPLLDILIVNERLIQKEPKKVQQFIQTWYEAVNYMKNHKKESNRFIASVLGISLKELEDALSLIIPCNSQYNKRLFGSRQKPGLIQGLTQKTADIYFKEGIIKEKTDIAQLINSSFI